MVLRVVLVGGNVGVSEACYIMSKKRVGEIKEVALEEGLSDVEITVNGHYHVSGLLGGRRVSFTVSHSPRCPHSLANFARDIRRLVRASRA